MKRLWSHLLGVRKQVTEATEVVQAIAISPDSAAPILINPSLQQMEASWLVVLLNGAAPTLAAAVALVQTDQLYSILIHQPGTLTGAELSLLQEYLAYCLLPIAAKKKGRAMAISHFAQSLDGKIATNAWDSKWIGNPGNLTHAHRMRALCDGIMIGTRTLQHDQPSLTVRHVSGDNPRRVVISSSARDFSSLFRSAPDPVLVFSCGEQDQVSGENLEYQQLPASSDGKISCELILQQLFERGIYSVYIEGGAETTSNFLREEMIDILQLHISPRIFGSGISGIVLPEIIEVQECVSFEKFSFLPVGDTVMFVGEPRLKADT
jgi:diaminohydroxyphosphoribosylaminopyrimidine deaminase/5-amino-6-(5-phosphoribosylamino)uracil reductase